MTRLIKICFLSIVLLIILYCYKSHSKNSKDKENFRVNSQNFVVNNMFEVADSLNYGTDDNLKGMYHSRASNPMGPSEIIGVGQNSQQDVYDNRGFNWTANTSDPQIDTFTKAVDDAQLRNRFERTYMLDPDGSVAQYDLTYNKISPSCCPAQYAPPFKLSDKDSTATNCEYAQKYVANQYSGMNFNDGYGCVCITPKQADFFGSRGGNTD